jgi:hypothetical protein
MGPSAGGLTCSLALVTLLSIISDTRSATPCPNCAVSTPAVTLKVGVGTLSFEVFDVSSCAAPTLPSFDAPESESGLVPCERLSAALALAAGETACATEAAAAAVTAADIAATDACANAAAAAAAAPAAGPLTAAAPDGRSLSEVANSSAKAESGAGALVPCATAAAMAACAAASVPTAADPLLEVESFSAVESLSPASPEDGVELADASVPWFAVAPPDLAAPPAATAGTVTVVGVPGAACVRMLTACGMLGPEAGTVGAIADGGILASTPAAEAGGTARAAAAARAEGTAAPGEGVEANAGVGAGGAAVSIFSAVKIVVAPLAVGGVVDAGEAPLGAGPCTLPGEPLAMPGASATTAAEPFAGGGELGPGGG